MSCACPDRAQGKHCLLCEDALRGAFGSVADAPEDVKRLMRKRGRLTDGEVIASAPEPEPVLWISGHNTAGFLPDTDEPAKPVSWEEAWNALLDEFIHAAPEADDNRPPLYIADALLEMFSAPPGQPLAVTVRAPGQVPEEWWIHPYDMLDEIDEQVAQITPEHIESRPQDTLRRAGYAPAPQSPPA
jgi:hypothetical protein